MIEKLALALEEISERHIAEAGTAKKRRSRIVWRAVAAMLAIAILLNLPPIPMIVRAKAVATASEPRITERPDSLSDAWDAWRAERDRRENLAEAAKDSLAGYFADSSQVFLSGTGADNRIWSPINGYIALAMLAEVTGGSSRQQILDLLGTADLDTLRSHVSAVWESVYQDNGFEISVLANSLWLDEALTYDQNTMDNVAYYHYASVYQGKLGSERTNKALCAWLNNNTGGLVRDQADSVTLPQEKDVPSIALASTVYIQSQWVDEFDTGNNTTDLFHTPGGDVECTFMNMDLYHTYYYWGESFGAVSMGLRNGSSMWFILPDEDKTVDDVLAEGEYIALLSDAFGTQQAEENAKYIKVNLSVPKFDVNSSLNLDEGFRELGITDVFDRFRADFSPSIVSDIPVFVQGASQAARVIIDEDGVKAASYILIPGAGAAAPPDEIIDFILDRPFLFVIEDSGLPLFVGVVNQP